MDNGSVNVGVGSFEVSNFDPESFDLSRFGLFTEIIDDERYKRSVERFKERKIALPTFSQLADPNKIPQSIRTSLSDVDRNDADPLNLYRVHWYNDFEGGFVDIPDHVILTSEMTGVESPIIVAFGNRFPMIAAHKVLAAYSCLVPRVVTGQYDPTVHRAIWPSTGNYARGGVAISRLMGCRGVAVLPENMSRERFEWLDRWVSNSEDVIRTSGSESNVKEIYDACHELEQDEGNFILNQFSEFANHIGHYHVSGPALAHVYTTLRSNDPGSRLVAFVAASGSAGTLGAGDWLKDKFAAEIFAVEALECPTMLYNGYGEHNIQGIGDKHIPLIHNVLNTDGVVGISDHATDGLNLVFNTKIGKDYLRSDMGVDPTIVNQLTHFGFSSIANMLAAIKTAKSLDLSAKDVLISVATDGSELYSSEKEKFLAAKYADGFTKQHADEIVSRYLMGADTEHVEQLDGMACERIFNLGYYTWVEQQGVAIEDFEVRRSTAFWDALHKVAPVWDEMIGEFNERTGLGV